MDLLIKNADIKDSKNSFFGDVYIKDGIIQNIGKGLEIEAENIIDINGKILMPSFVDMHVHFREPGFTYKEDLESGAKAAIKGGFTLVNLMGNTDPIASSMDIVDYIDKRSKEIDLIDMHQTLSITENFDGETLSHLDNISKDVKCISDDGKGVVSNLVMYQAMEKALDKDIFIMIHPEDSEISDINPRLSENLMTLRDIILSEATGARLHVAHISTKEIVEYVRFAKKKNINVTCEVAPHHFSLWDNDYKVNPPIRGKEDVDSIIGAIIDGTIDMIATDHAPHTENDKEKGAPGISGLETSFAISYTSLVREGHIGLNKLSQLMSDNPSKLLGVNKGRILPGFDGDLVIVDIEKKIKIDKNNFVSKGKNTPFHDKTYYGEVLATIKAGKIKYDGGL